MNTYLTQRASSESVVRSFMGRTYSWMTAGLVLTAVIAYLTGHNENTLAWAGQNVLLLFIAQFGVVMFLSFAIQRISSMVAGVLFMAYAALTGLTFSLILQRYTGSDVTAAFLSSAGTFGVMSAYGYFTKRNLSAWGNFLMFALIGLVIAMLVNLFVASGPLSLVISGIGVLLFAALTAYDTNKLRQIALTGMDGELAEKTAVFGALQLYLDFINMFLFLLRLFGAGGSSRN
ncbi:Bax inhibitor-1/YccA family protein [Deinococcus sonorensis]|uniref:Bax inhibitor-1/YccA family protein n=2 Tax=Deinococcus sonorensis TaxID=309891 RepID=A0AAU7U9D8_9DEIO